MNVRLQVAGRDVQWTLRDADERLAQRLEALLARYPVPTSVSPRGAAGSGGKDWCAVHESAMKRNHGKDGKSDWYSHRLADGTWCKGRRR